MSLKNRDDKHNTIVYYCLKYSILFVALLWKLYNIVITEMLEYIYV